MEAYSTTWEASAQSQYSGQVFQLPPRPASVETSANKQQNSPASYTIYKYYNNYNTTTRSLNYILVEHTVFVQEYRTPSMGLVSHRRSVFIKWARPTNFPDNNNDLRNESSTKIIYSMRETAWIANTLADFFCSQMNRTSRRHFANSKNRALRKNAWNFVNLNSTGSHNYPQCIADMLTLQVKCVSKVSSRERLWNRSNSDANMYGRVQPTWGVNSRPATADLRSKGLTDNIPFSPIHGWSLRPFYKTSQYYLISVCI